MYFFAFEELVLNRSEAEPFIKRNVVRVLRFKAELIAERNKVMYSLLDKLCADSFSLMLLIHKNG